MICLWNLCAFHAHAHIQCSEAFSYFFFFILNLGDQARSMLIQSGLSQGILAQIW